MVFRKISMNRQRLLKPIGFVLNVPPTIKIYVFSIYFLLISEEKIKDRMMFLSAIIAIKIEIL